MLQLQMKIDEMEGMQEQLQHEQEILQQQQGKLGMSCIESTDVMAKHTLVLEMRLRELGAKLKSLENTNAMLVSKFEY